MHCRSVSTSRRSTEAIDIVGAPELLVRLSSDRPQANIAVRLCDVHPDGASELISYGVLNLTHRNSHEFPEPLVPGETVTAQGRARPVRLPRAGRPPSAHCRVERLLADDLAVARTGPARALGRDADAAAAPSGARRRDHVRRSRRRHALGDRDGPADQFRTPCRSRREDRHRHAVDHGRFRRGARSRSTASPMAASPARHGRSIPTIRCRRRERPTGRRPCREMDGRCAPRHRPKCGPTRKTSSSAPESKPMKAKNWFSSATSRRQSLAPCSERSLDWSNCDVRFTPRHVAFGLAYGFPLRSLFSGHKKQENDHQVEPTE